MEGPGRSGPSGRGKRALTMVLGAANKYTHDISIVLCCNTFHTVRGDAPKIWTCEFEAR